jgi:hypothetical protein
MADIVDPDHAPATDPPPAPPTTAADPSQGHTATAPLHPPRNSTTVAGRIGNTFNSSIMILSKKESQKKVIEKSLKSH